MRKSLLNGPRDFNTVTSWSTRTDQSPLTFTADWPRKYKHIIIVFLIRQTPSTAVLIFLLSLPDGHRFAYRRNKKSLLKVHLQKVDMYDMPQSKIQTVIKTAGKK